MDEDNSTYFRFLDLPPELQSRIVTEYYAGPWTLADTKGRWILNPHGNTESQFHNSLPLVNKHIHDLATRAHRSIKTLHALGVIHAINNRTTWRTSVLFNDSCFKRLKYHFPNLAVLDIGIGLSYFFVFPEKVIENSSLLTCLRGEIDEKISSSAWRIFTAAMRSSESRGEFCGITVRFCFCFWVGDYWKLGGEDRGLYDQDLYIELEMGSQGCAVTRKWFQRKSANGVEWMMATPSVLSSDAQPTFVGYDP